MEKILLVILIFAVTFAFTSCSKNETASGSEDKIYVIADSSVFTQLFPVMDSVFGKIIYTPQPEKTFEIIRVDYNQFEDIKTSKNIIVVAPLNTDGEVTKFANSILDSKLKNKALSNNEFAFNKYSLWAKDQLVLVLTAPTINQLESYVLNNGTNLLYYFQKVSNKRLAQNLYNKKYENKEAEAKFLRDYGWMIYVHSDYNVVHDNSEDKFVCLRNTTGKDMEKWIFVHWIENATPEFLHPDSIINERDRIAKKYYHESDADGRSTAVIAKNYNTTTEINFLDRYALVTQGLWEMDNKSKGGPFINYTFFDETTRRIYMLDGAIFAPKYLKKTLIQQVDVTLQSFLTEQQISAKKKKEFLSLLDKQ